MTKVIICGAGGRMGKENISVFSEDSEVEIVGAIEKKDSIYCGQDAGSLSGIKPLGVNVEYDLEKCIQKADAIVEFTNPEATLSHLEVAKKYKKAIVIGTTGFSLEQVSLIRNYSNHIPIVFSPNMSQGVNVLFFLVRKACELLGKQFEVEIVEVHHNLKKDAPSGTALQFGKIIADLRGNNFEEIVAYGRKGISGPRKKDEIGIMSIRIGDVVGDHTIIFGGTGERIELTHKSSSRKTFACGALRALKFVVDKEKGLYTMEDVLGIKY